MRKQPTYPGDGHPPHVPTDKDRGIVESMVAVGIAQLDIARIIGISDTTLRKYYSEQIETGAVKANAQVGRTWFQRATGGGDWKLASDTALIWWTKVRMGAKEPRQEFSLEHRDMTEISDSELVAILRRAHRGGTAEAEEGPNGDNSVH